MSLGNHILVFQADRQLLELLIQERALIGSRSATPPIFLKLPPPPASGPALIHKPQSPLDAIVDSCQLELTPGGDTGSLVLNIYAGILRLPGHPAVMLKGSKLRLGLKFVKGKFYTIQWTGITFEQLAANLAALANAEAAKLLGSDLETQYPLFDDLPAQYSLAVAISSPRVIDPQTVAIMTGSGDGGAVTRFLSAGSQVAAGISANYVRGTQLCRALLTPQEQDPTWNNTMMGPTALERSRLPKGDCGDGEQSRGKDGVDVKITETRFTFDDGYIDVTGKFNAEDTCWSVEGGSFSQKLFFDFNNVTGQLTPRLEPLEPILDYEVDLDFLCELAAFGIGLITPIIGSVVLGIGAVIAANVAANAFSPPMDPNQVPPFLIPALPNVRWMTLTIEPEGMFLQGAMIVSLPAFDPAPLLWFSVADQPQDVQAGRGGAVTYAPPMCTAREFEYRDYTQNDHKVLVAVHQRLIEPVTYEWLVNGQLLPGGQAGVLPITTTVRTALPPPDGVDVPGFEVQLAYDTGAMIGLISPNPSEITLTARAEDLNYSMHVELRATDAAGRKLWHSAVLKFEGSFVRFGPDYHEYVGQCLDKLGDYMDKKGRKARRPKPGQPVMGLDKYIQVAVEHIEAGNPAITEYFSELVKGHGLAAVNQAFAAKTKKVQ